MRPQRPRRQELHSQQVLTSGGIISSKSSAVARPSTAQAVTKDEARANSLQLWLAEAPLGARLEDHEAPADKPEAGGSRESQVFWRRRCYGRRAREATLDGMGSGQRDQLTSTRNNERSERLLNSGQVLAEHWGRAHSQDHVQHLKAPLRNPEFEVSRALPPSLVELAEDLLRESGRQPSERAEAKVVDVAFFEAKGNGNGCEEHCNAYACEFDWAHPSVAAYGTPLAEIQRCNKWKLHRALAAGGSALPGGKELADRAERADVLELIGLAPQVAACAQEMPKEAALKLAVRLGETADSIKDTSASAFEVLRESSIALLASVAARARNAHGPDLLVEALESLQKLGITERTYIDMLLSALFNWTSRAPLQPTLALRAACALTSLADAVAASGGLRLAAGSRRAVGAVRAAIAGDDTMAVNRHVFDVLGGLASSATWYDGKKDGEVIQSNLENECSQSRKGGCLRVLQPEAHSVHELVERRSFQAYRDACLVMSGLS